jgi:hypothetical protein
MDAGRSQREARRPLGIAAAMGSMELVVIGIAYALNPETTGGRPAEPVGWWLATLAFIGAVALAATGLWQWISTGGMRVLFLATMAGLSAVWISANTVAILAHGEGPPAIPLALHWIGLAASGMLFIGSLAVATMSVLDVSC